MIQLKLIIATLFLIAPLFAHGGPILFSSNGSPTQIDATEPLGQSFVAEDALVEAGLYFDVINPTFANDDAIVYQLFEGIGASGPQLASFSFSLADSFIGFYLVDFSATPLTVGNTYSLAVSIDGDSPYWGADQTFGAPSGSGFCDFPQAPFVCDGKAFALSVNPFLTEVAEPGALALLGLGLAGMGLARRRKNA